MLFPTHLAAGYLLGRRVRWSTMWVVVGAALPDLVDKPLALAGAVDLYHSVGHSLVLAAVLLPLAARDGRGTAALVGWASHLLLDAVHVVVNGRAADAAFLGWPLVVPPSPPALGPVAFARVYVGTPAFVLDLAIWAALAWTLLAGRRSAPAHRPGD